MLATDPRMQDIDTDQWRNLQTLTVVSAKARPRIIVIHDHGRVQKFRHSEGEPINGPTERTVDDPAALAERVYAANQNTTDFVAVFDRDAVDAYYARLQDSWSANEDLDIYVHRSLTLLDEFADGIVTHPGPARAQLGLQYRLGGSYEQVESAIAAFVEPGDVVVFGVVDEDQLWTSLVLGFDGDKKISTITTVDPAGIGGELPRIAEQVDDQVARRHRTPALALFVDRALAGRLVAGFDVTTVRAALADGSALLGTAPTAVADLLRPES